MNQRGRIAHNGDMAAPEQEIATRELREIDGWRYRFPDRSLLHVAVARASNAAETSRLSALAVFILIANSYRLGA